MQEFLLIRHGETDFNRDRRFLGFTDIGLNDTGRAQVLGLRGKLGGEDIASVHSSDLLRCAETCRLLGFEDRAVYSENLREMNFGEWEGLTYKEIKTRYNDPFSAWQSDGVNFRVPGGESLGEMSDRVISRFEEIRQGLADRKGTAAVVTHAGCIRTLLTHYLLGSLNDPWKFFVDNGAAARLCFNKNYAYLKITQ